MQAFLLIGGIIAFIYSAILKIPVHKPGSWFEKMLSFFNITVVIPLYAFLIIILIIYFAYRYLKNRIISQTEFKARMIGKWLNRWGGSQPGQEIFTITNDFKYLIGNTAYFDFKRFRINTKRKAISFTKIGVRDGDARILQNTLSFDELNELKGTEKSKGKEYGITYTRVEPGSTNLSAPYIRVTATCSLSVDPTVTHPLKLDFLFQGLQDKPIAIHSVRFEANPILQIDNRAVRFSAPNSYNCNLTHLKKEQYQEEIVINKVTAATCWVPYAPEVGKYTLDKALDKSLCGTLFFNYSFMDDRTKTYLYIGSF